MSTLPWHQQSLTVCRVNFCLLSQLAAHMNQEISREKWCKSRAIQILCHSESRYFVQCQQRFQKGCHARRWYRSQAQHEHDSVGERLKTKSESSSPMLKRLIGSRNSLVESGLPPMVSPPLARPIETPDLRWLPNKRYARTKTIGFGHCSRQHLSRARFLPSAEAIGVINSFRTTTWKVDKYEPHDNQPIDTYSVVKEVLEHEIKSNILEHLTIEEKMEIWCYHLRTSNRASAKLERTGPRVDGHVPIYRSLHEEFPGEPHFWHAWQFDWRGRMNPTTPMLSPQNDDVCRGLLRFAKPVRLDAEGLKWLGASPHPCSAA